jgi:DNA polymerase-3 subunit alpha
MLRELGKVFGLPKTEIESLIYYAGKPDYVPDQYGKLIIKYSQVLHGMPSHLTIHACGILISHKPIHYYTATDMPPKGFPLAHIDMHVAEDIGLYKFDILSQRGLGHIKSAIQIIEQNQGVKVDIREVEKFKKDPKIKEHLRDGHTIGAFYVESPAMRMLLAKMKADEYLELVAASSIIRPGVARSGMMREYILRHVDPERRKTAHPVMMDIMPETYGIMVYQEDVIKVAHYFAGKNSSMSMTSSLSTAKSWAVTPKSQQRSGIRLRALPDILLPKDTRHPLQWKATRACTSRPTFRWSLWLG